MRIDVEDVFSVANEMWRFNKPPLKDIEFYRDGKKVDVPDSVIED